MFSWKGQLIKNLLSYFSNTFELLWYLVFPSFKRLHITRVQDCLLSVRIYLYDLKLFKYRFSSLK